MKLERLKIEAQQISQDVFDNVDPTKATTDFWQICCALHFSLSSFRLLNCNDDLSDCLRGYSLVYRDNEQQAVFRPALRSEAN